MVLFWERKISCESHHPVVVDLISSSLWMDRCLIDRSRSDPRQSRVAIKWDCFEMAKSTTVAYNYRQRQERLLPFIALNW